MSVNLKSYSFPVVNNENDVEGRFSVAKIEKTVYPDYYLLSFSFEITNQSLLDYIRARKAEIVVQFSCSNTFYRGAYRTFDLTGSVQLPSEKLREKVQVAFYVCSCTDIPDYRLEGVHPDYAGMSFEVEKGDVLALGGTTSFIAEKTYDPLNAPIDSLFRFKAVKEQGSFDIELDDDKIVVTIPEEEFKLQAQAGQTKLSGMIHSSIVLPALICAIQQMDDELFKNYAWVDRIKEIARDRSVNLKYPLRAAQIILGNPVNRCFSETFKLIQQIEGGE